MLPLPSTRISCGSIPTRCWRRCNRRRRCRVHADAVGAGRRWCSWRGDRRRCSSCREERRGAAWPTSGETQIAARKGRGAQSGADSHMNVIFGRKSAYYYPIPSISSRFHVPSAYHIFCSRVIAAQRKRTSMETHKMSVPQASRNQTADRPNCNWRRKPLSNPSWKGSGRLSGGSKNWWLPDMGRQECADAA